ncbi:MAG: glycerate kinase [Mycobacterium sp.]|nr:glycerate kinase [Mycobacterium sp.]
MGSVLIAPDKFKGSMTAAEVASALAAGIRQARPRTSIDLLPVADGGEGTLAAALAAAFELVPVRATGPTSRPVDSGFARRGDLAVVELADVSGLERLPAGVAAPMMASTRGTGEVILAAVEDGCRRIVLGLGGSASTDGGAGIASALGATMRDRSGQRLPDGGRALAGLRELDTQRLRELMEGIDVVVACDVDNPLLGPTGAAATYGPQKGASPAQVVELDRCLAHWADIVAGATGNDPREVPGAGAAGGVGFAALALLDATLRPGIELVLDLVGFGERLVGVDLVITGEGSMDDQTLNGKAPMGVAKAASIAGIEVVAVCGRNSMSRTQLRRSGIGTVYPLTDLEPDVERCLREPHAIVEQIGRRIALTHLPD